MYHARTLPTNVLMREVGLSKTEFWQAWMKDENPDDLVKRKQLTIYREMQRRDETIKMALRLVALAVVSPGWKVQPAKAGDPQSEEIARFVEWNLRNLPGTLKDVELGILSGRAYGFSLTEINWGIIEKGPWKGKYGLKSLKTKPPFNYGFRRDDYGNLEALVMESKLGEHEDLPPDKFIIYSHDAGSVFGDPHGQSAQRPAYRWYSARQMLLPMRGVFVEKVASGVPHLKYPRGISPAERAKYQKAGKKLQTAASFSSPDDVILEFVGLKSASWQEFQRFDDACARGEMDALLTPSNLGFGPRQSAGSRAESKTHKEIFGWISGDLDTDLTRSCMTEQLIHRLVDLNYEVEEYPSFEHDKRDWEEAIEVVATFAEAKAHGAVGPLTLPDVNKSRRLLEYPELSEKEWKERKEDGPPTPDEEARSTPLPMEPGEEDAGSEDNPDVEEPKKTSVTVPGMKDKIRTASADEMPTIMVVVDPKDRDLLEKLTERAPEFARRQFVPVSEASVRSGIHENPAYLRELTTVEKSAGFKPTVVQKAMEKLEKKAVAQMGEAMGRIEEKILAKFGREGFLDGSGKEADLYPLGGLDGRAKRDFGNTLFSLMLSADLNGAANAVEEMEKAGGKRLTFEKGARDVSEFLTVTGDLLFPAEAEAFFGGLVPITGSVTDAMRKRAFWITGSYLNDDGSLLRQLKNIVHTGYFSGNWGQVEGRLSAVFDEWRGTGEIVDEVRGTYRLYSPYHAENIARTNSMRGYNQGRMRMYMKARDWWEVFQWSSIIDARTTDFCDLMDRQTYRLGQVDPPPAHHSCRSTFFAVMRGQAHRAVDDNRIARLKVVRAPDFTS